MNLARNLQKPYQSDEIYIAARFISTFQGLKKKDNKTIATTISLKTIKFACPFLSPDEEKLFNVEEGFHLTF